ncbi:MAG: alpha/beta hydrolase [Chloroflexi bacterium]|nr:MAG: alpha/beta hydrolase [Chloroflexota bacterium]
MARDEDLSITAGQVVLAGTLTRPEPTGEAAASPDHRWPAVLLLPSVLPRDRDGRFDAGRHHGWFAPEQAPAGGLLGRLAAALAAHGVASLRVDKRGCGSSGGEWSTAGLFTLVDDARDALSTLRGHDTVDPTRIGLVGHGEGAWLALSVAAADPGIGPLTLVGAPARGLRDVLRRAAAERARNRNGTSPEPRHPFVAAFDRGLEELIERAERGEPEMTLTMAGGRPLTLGLAGWEQAMRIPTRALATLQRRSVTLLHGEADEWFHPDESVLLAAALAASAAPRRILVPSAGHDLVEAAPALIGEVAADLAARLQPRRLPTVLLSIGLR